jgi:hypothetical protein
LQANTSNVKIYQKGDFQEGVDKYEPVGSSTMSKTLKVYKSKVQLF